MAVKAPRKEELQEEHWKRTIALTTRVTIRVVREQHLPHWPLVSAVDIPLAH